LKRKKGGVRVGTDSVVMGRVSGKVGDRSVVIGATDDRGNVILNQSMAVGYNAHAGPGSIAIGANASAGSELPAILHQIEHIIRESNDRPLQLTFDRFALELRKKEPERTAIQTLWTVIQTSATLAGASDFVVRASELLRIAGLV
jgi:hypothetical protein